MHTPAIPAEVGHMLPSNGNSSNSAVNIEVTTAAATASATLDSWHLWCRLCAKEDPQGNINVYFKDEQSTNFSSNSNNMTGDQSLIAAIEKYFFVEISRNNELPKMLCTECFSLVTALVNFSERVTKVQQMFYKLERASEEENLDLHAVRLKFGLLDEDREHVLMPQALPEVHYFEAKPKINELEEKIFEAESATLATLTNPLEQQPRIRIKIKKENITEDGRQLQQQQQHTIGDDEDDNELEAEATSTMDEDPCEENDDNDNEGDAADEEDPFNADEAADLEFKPELSSMQSASDSNSDVELEDETVKRKLADIKQELTQLQKPTASKRQNTRQRKRHTRRKRSDATVDKDVSDEEDAGADKGAAEASDDSDYNENGDTTTKNTTRPRIKRRHKSNKETEGDLPLDGDVAPGSLYECSECPRRFKLVRFYRQHMKRAHAKQAALPELQCGQCSRVFNTQNQLKRHATVHLPAHLRNVLPCPYCEKKFSSNTQVQSHVKIIHLDERPFVCEECGITQRTNSALRVHMLTHTDYAPFECQVCKKRFKNKPRLRNHMETHNPHKHICAECGLQLNSRPTLNRHLLVHSDQMQHKCDYCGRAFKRAKALKNHLILHTGLKPYSCDFCDRTFANGSNCRTHKKKSHPEELAALEAAGGGKTYNRNIPKLAALKAVTRAADNLAPVVSKQSGRFAFGKKPKPLAQTNPSKQQLDQRARNENKLLNAAVGSSTTNGEVAGGAGDRSIASQLDVNTLPTSVAGIPTIDNIYSHIMKQAHIVATQADAEQHALTSSGTPSAGLHLKRPPSAASSIGVASSSALEQDMQMPVDASVAHLQQLQQQRQRQQQQQQLLLQQQQSQQPTTTSNDEQQFYAQIIKNNLTAQQQQQQRNHLLTPDDIASMRSPDSQASSNTTTATNANNNSTQQQRQQLTDDQHSNASNTHFYAQIRQQQSNLQGSYI